MLFQRVKKVLFYVKKSKKIGSCVTIEKSLSLYFTSIKKRTVVSKPTLTLLALIFSTALFSQDMADAGPKESEPENVEDIIAKKIYVTKGIEQGEPPAIDGLLNDPIWQTVDWAGDYIERQPDENTPPSYQTKFKIVYDNKYLYIGVRCLDAEPENIVRRMSRRDGFDGDWVEFNIDSYHDKRTAFSFTVTAAGVKGDELVSENGNNWDDSWNPIWYTRTNVDDQGWTAELKIPFSQIKFGKEQNQVWGLQSTRRFFREEERSLWQRVPLDAPGWVSEFGELHGLKNIEPQKQLEIQPYTVVSGETFEAEEGNPFRTGNENDINFGLDAKIGITNDLTLDLTVNPDFGQIGRAHV